MASGGEVHLQLDHVEVSVKNAVDEYLGRIALQIEAQTKVNIQTNGQIDTGFMLNSTYTVSKKTDTYGQAYKDGPYPNKAGETVLRKIAAKTNLPGHARAAVVVGAIYAIYQEERRAFLFPASQTVANQTKGTAEKVIRELLND